MSIGADGTADLWAREQIGKLWGELRELASDYWGPNRDNGRRSTIKALEDKTGELDIAQRNLLERLRHYLDAEREQSCLGLAELARREERLDEDERKEEAVDIAKIQAAATKAAADAAAQATTKAQRLALLGVLGAGLLSNLDKIFKLLGISV